MKFPDYPRSGFPIVQTVKDIIHYLRSSRVISINGIKGTSSINGTTFDIPIGEKNRKQKDFLHPFKMFSSVDSATSERRLYIQAGRCTTYAISASGIPNVVELPVQFQDEASDLSNDEFGLNSVEGYSVLTASKTYGVWVVASQFEGTNTPPSSITNYSQLVTYAPIITGAPWVYVTDVSGERNYDEGPAVITALTASGISLVFYIGQITTDSNAVPTFKQWRKTDIFAQITAFPDDFAIASADAGNSITTGTDGLPFVPPIVSGDANNSISSGTDNGAYYDAP